MIGAYRLSFSSIQTFQMVTYYLAMWRQSWEDKPPPFWIQKQIPFFWVLFSHFFINLGQCPWYLVLGPMFQTSLTLLLGMWHQIWHQMWPWVITTYFYADILLWIWCFLIVLFFCFLFSISVWNKMLILSL